eukprot:6185922-Pleurochrysis_carterae.AAC.1
MVKCEKAGKTRVRTRAKDESCESAKSESGACDGAEAGTYVRVFGVRTSRRVSARAHAHVCSC